MKRLYIISIVAVVSLACSGDNDNAHTTATTFVSPPPRQVLQESRRQRVPPPESVHPMRAYTDKPFLFFNLPNGKTFREGEEVVINFTLVNAKLREDGGDFRIRYMVDDDDIKWIDRQEDVVLTGWLPGKHTIGLELVGADSWPLRDNILTREITVVK
jgi:hypothetical protein